MKLIVLFFLLTLSGSLIAHPVWVKPSMFTVSTNEGEWVAFDVSASHTVFAYDKPLPLEELRIFSPDGDSNYLGSYTYGRRRSAFDYHITQEGTYRFSFPRMPYYYTEFKAGKRETLRYIDANKVEASLRLPENSREVKTTVYDMEASAYVTKGAPSNLVLNERGRGFQYIPITHPNDLFVGEEATFKVTLDGKAISGVNIEFTPEGTHYRDDRKVQVFTTDAEGFVRFTPDQAGLWYSSADHTLPVASGLADEAYTVRFITLEVQSE
jgi:uncharacterized GH25 family protein